MAHPRQFWESLIARYERDGGAQLLFAEQHGVSVAALRHWLYRLRRERAPRAPRLVQIVPTGVMAPGVDRTADIIEVALLGQGIALRFAQGTDTAYVGRLVGALRGGC